MNNEIVTYTPNPAATLVEIRRDNERFPRLHSYPQGGRAQDDDGGSS